jgi:hypothetical protein
LVGQNKRFLVSKKKNRPHKTQSPINGRSVS